jgi:putative transposase
MIVKKTFRFCLLPTASQEETFFQFAGACRFIYNRGLSQKKEAWEKEKRSITLFDQNKELTELKQQEKTVWLKTIHSQVLQQSLEDLDKAYQHFFRRVKNKEVSGYPKFKCRGDKDSFRYPQGVKLENNRVFLPKIGWVRFRKSREVKGELKQTTVILEGNKWYVCFSCEWEEASRSFTFFPSDVLRIDLGLEHFATLASREVLEEIANPRFLRQGLKHLRYLSRQLSKKLYRSKNWEKAKAKLQIFAAKVQRKRQDFLHKLSTRIVESQDVIVVESLKIKGLLMKVPKALARSISDAGWGKFLQMLKYKCEYAGKKLIEASAFFPSTQLCSRCQTKNSIDLSTREYRCNCGLVVHRDHNAALNLRAVGMTVLKACGAAL